MVTIRNPLHSRRAFLEVDLLAAVALLCVALLPLAYSFINDRRAIRDTYERAVAMQLLDGEMEILVAGAGRQYPLGTNELTLTGNAVTNLSSRHALLLVQPGKFRLEWHPARLEHPTVIREVNTP
jgi:hypothetical protein